METYKVLAINPGSTSTKVAVFENDKEIFNIKVTHDADKLDEYDYVCDQLPYRLETILKVCREQGVDFSDCAAFVGRGGSIHSCTGGTYEVNDIMIEHAREGGGVHPASLGCQIAQDFANQYGKRAFIVNPPDVDEFCDEARVTGLSDIYRTSSSHALNQKETAIRVAADLGKTYEESNFIVAHIGGGVSVTAHRQGKMVDSNGIIYGEGPMAPTRSGALPAIPLIDMCFSGKYTREEMHKRINKSGGFVDLLGTSEMIEVVEMKDNGDKYAELVYNAFLYQIAKEAGAMAAVLKGKVDAIILTGGISHNVKAMDRLEEMIGFIAPVIRRPGEFEMEALAAGAIRVLKGEEEVKIYDGITPWSGFDRGAHGK